MFPPAARQSDPGVGKVVGELRAPAEETHQCDVSLRPPLPIQEAAASVPHQVEHRDESVEHLLLSLRPVAPAVAGEGTYHVERIHCARK